MKRAILFDLDGTLIDSLIDISEVANQLRRDSGLPPLSPNQVRQFVGKGAENLIEGIVPGTAPDAVPALVEKYRQYYLAKEDFSGALYPGVLPTLQALSQKAGLSIGVVTNKLSLIAEKTLEHYLPGLRFGVIFGPDRVSQRKPNRAHLLEALAELDVSPSSAWYIGDDPVDALCAESAGVNFLGAIYGIGGVRVPAARQLAAFPEILKKIPFD